jgi:hypothetical protein
MYRLLIAYPLPLNVPVKLVVLFPTGTNPAPPFHAEVPLALMALFSA